MKIKFLLILAVCGLAKAKENSTEASTMKDTTMNNTTLEMKPTVNITEVATKPEVIICEMQPCMWSIYENKARSINITNTHCVCPSGKKCLKDKDDENSKTWIYRCK